MINVEAEVNKHKNIKDRTELEKLIQEYKSLAIQYAANLTLAGQYSMVANKLKEICDRLPAPKLKNYPIGGTQGGHAKTAMINKDEKARINADWERKTKK